MTDSNDTIAMDNPMAVDRALAQTAAVYDRADVDVMAMEAWMSASARGETSFPWYRYCGNKETGWTFKRMTNSDNEADYVPIEDGNYLLCLKDRDHEGECR